MWPYRYVYAIPVTLILNMWVCGSNFKRESKIHKPFLLYSIDFLKVGLQKKKKKKKKKYGKVHLTMSSFVIGCFCFCFLLSVITGNIIT